MKARLLPSLVLLVPVLSGCVLIAGAGVGYVISHEVLPNSVHEAQVSNDVEQVWSAARETFEIMLDIRAEMTITKSPRRIEGLINGATVKLDVEAFDIDRTLIRIEASKYLSNDSATAGEVMDRLLGRLTK